MSPELEQIRREVERLTGGWSESDWHLALDGKWSSGQILEHLLLSFKGTTKGVLKAMEAGRPLGGKPTLRDWMATLYVAKLGLMPAGRRSPEIAVPQHGLDADSLRRFYDALVALDATLADAERRFGSQVKLLDHPILGPLSSRDWRRFHQTHAKHHLKQIARIRRNGQPRYADRELSH
ncbi:MAG TPA: DUF1569 domain-containing protein [Terriglobales bacterium]|nr:DUF1569 domain-containing protein [Terriglobales bacterium]